MQVKKLRHLVHATFETSFRKGTMAKSASPASMSLCIWMYLTDVHVRVLGVLGKTVSVRLAIAV